MPTSSTIWEALLLKLRNREELALKKHKGNYEAQLALSSSAKDELTWWIENVNKAFNPVSHGNPVIELRTDASKKGCACILMVKLPKVCGLF